MQRENRNRRRGYNAAASSDKRNVTVWRPLSVSVCSAFLLTLIARARHIQRDSPWVSTRRGQRTFPSEYYEDGHTCLFCHKM